MEHLWLTLDDGQAASASLQVPADPVAGFVFAHGAGAGMHHAFMSTFAAGLATRGVATLRYQFPYMERGSKRVDAPAVAHAAVRAAVAAARTSMRGLPLFAGGKSYGGRMTSQAQAAAPMADVKGIVLVGFPLHPAGKPSSARAAHLEGVDCPMLFLQGTRDDLADASLMTQVVAGLGARASIAWFDDADHAFHVRKASGSTDQAVMAAMLDTTRAWMASHA